MNVSLRFFALDLVIGLSKISNESFVVWIIFANTTQDLVAKIIIGLVLPQDCNANLLLVGNGSSSSPILLHLFAT